MFRVFILLASPDSDKHDCVNEAKSVNKDLPLPVNFFLVECMRFAPFPERDF